MLKRRNKTVANLLCLMAALLVSFSELVHPLLHQHGHCHDALHEHAVSQCLPSGGNGWFLDDPSDDLDSPESGDACPICAGLLSCEPAEPAPEVPVLHAVFPFICGGSTHPNPFIPFVLSRGPPEGNLF